MNTEAQLWLEAKNPYTRCQVLTTLETRPEMVARTILGLCEEGHYHEAVLLTEALELVAEGRRKHNEYITVRPASTRKVS